MRLAALLLAIAAMLAAPAVGGAATLRGHVTVDDTVVRLGDLFNDAGPAADTAVARAPAPGRRNVFGANWLWQVARAYQLDWRPQNRFERAIVERAGRIVSASEITAHLADALAAEGAPRGSDVELIGRTTDAAVALDAPATIEVRDVSFDPTSNRFSAIVTVGGDHPSAQRLTLFGRVHRMTSVPVLRRAMGPDDVIRKDDLEQIRVREASLPRDALTEARLLVGTAPRQRLRAGEIIREGDTRPPVLVARNSIVMIVLETGSMTLTAQGRAVEDGAKGDVVRIMNLRSKKTVEAVVAGPDLVTISLGTHRILN